MGLFKADKTTLTDIYIITMTSRARKVSWSLANKLRVNGFSVQIDLMRRSERKQREYANKKNIPVIIIIGDKELEKNEVTLYFRNTGERFVIRMDEVIEFLTNKLRTD